MSDAPVLRTRDELQAAGGRFYPMPEPTRERLLMREHCDTPLSSWRVIDQAGVIFELMEGPGDDVPRRDAHSHPEEILRRAGP